MCTKAVVLWPINPWKTDMTIEAGKSYFFTKSSNEVQAMAPTTSYRGLAIWEVERTTGASAGKRMDVPARALVTQLS